MHFGVLIAVFHFKDLFDEMTSSASDLRYTIVWAGVLGFFVVVPVLLSLLLDPLQVGRKDDGKKYTQNVLHAMAILL